MNKKTLTLRLFALAAIIAGAFSSANAQETMATTNDGNDFGIDLNLEVEKKLTRGLSLSIEGGFRSQNDTESKERWQVGASLNYRLFRTSNKRFTLKGSTGFAYAWKQNLPEVVEHYTNSTHIFNGYNRTERYWRQRSRVFTALGGSYSPNKRWTFSLKETFQYNHYLKGDSVSRTKFRYNDDDELYAVSDAKAIKSKDKMLVRSKLTVEYNVKGLPINPYASVEYAAGQNNVERWKYVGGLEYKFSKACKLDVFYRFQKENDDDEPNGHFVGWNLKFSF